MRWRRRMHQRHGRSLTWQYRQHEIAMRGAPTIKVGSIGELIERAGHAIQAAAPTPVMRRIGALLTEAGRADFTFQLGNRLAERAHEELGVAARRVGESLVETVAKSFADASRSWFNQLATQHNAALGRAMTQVRDARACPKCGAAVGVWCRVESGEYAGKPTIHRERQAP